MTTSRLLSASTFAAACFVASRASAHRDDYINETFVYQTVARGELTLEGWADFRDYPMRPDAGWYTGAVELGLTDRWMIDAAAQWLQDENPEFGFGRLRAETRYRFAEEGVWPVDLATSLEYEIEGSNATGSQTEHVITPRLVLSRDLVPQLNTTLNLDLPITIAPQVELAFAYSVGVRYPARGVVRAGVEFRQVLDPHRAQLFPQFWFQLPHELTVKLGLGIGLTSQTESFIGRVAMEIEI